jgi:hypothetical protein
LLNEVTGASGHSHHSKRIARLEAKFTGRQDARLHCGGTLPSVPVMAASSRQLGAGAKVRPEVTA